jgi:hypothetical protein
MKAKIAFVAGVFAASTGLAPGTGGLSRAADVLTWGKVVARSADGCDAFSPVLAHDGHSYTSYGDCTGLTGTLPKLSMGLGRLLGGPANPTVQDLPTNDLRDVGNGPAGQKPSSALVHGNRLYVWVRNYGPNGTQARLKYSDDFTRRSNSTWTWANMTLPQFGYPVFVQGKPSEYYAYFIAHDNNSAYVPADRFVLMRVPLSKLATQAKPEYFSGDPAHPLWSSSYQARKAIFTADGKCYRSGISYNRFRDRYYWWQNNGNSLVTNSFEVWSGSSLRGPWTRIFYTRKWDMNPGERGEFPAHWMGRQPIGEPGTLYLVFSGHDRLNIRKATIAAGH